MQSQATTLARPRALRVLPAPAELDVPRVRRQRAGTVSRTRLVKSLATTSQAVVAALVAPAGYGKTTLLAEWEARDPRPFTWIERDDDPERLFATLAARLGSGGPPSVLVVDDLHTLRRPALDAVSAIADRVRPGSMLAVASRREPGLPLGRLRARGELVELRVRDLAMDEREARTLLRRAGLRLGDAEVATIMRRTEGWPAGLYLAALSLLDQDDVSAAVARFAGDDRIVADYLRLELLEPLGDDDLDFLTRTSPLDELSGPFCDAVLGRRGSGRVLRSLSRANVLTALDRSEERFRAHPLLADMLRAELRRDDPAREMELHRRASAWLEGGRDLDGAIAHAAAAGDAERAGTLLWSVAGEHAAGGRLDAIDRWLARFADREIAASPRLALSAALHRAAAGRRDEAERWANAAERALGDAAPGEAGLPLVRAMIARDGIARMGEDAARAYALDADDGHWRAAARLLEGVAHHLTGDAGRARAELEEGARRSAHGAPAVHALCLAQLALAALEQAEWERGAALADRALGCFADTAPSSGLVHATAAFAHAHRGRIDEARRHAAAARRRLEPSAGYAPWYGAEMRIALARAALRMSDAAEARAMLAEASRELRRAPDAVLLQAWIDDAWLRADAFAAAAVAGPSALTTAELRVLRFLPSHLSFREIAARLHVSANTVKTQAHAVYRKLDSSSRSEAVARARDVGLIDEGLGDREP